MITFAGGSIDLDTLYHENMHQWWGDNVSEANYNLTFYKEGFATLGEYLFGARVAGQAAGGSSTAAGRAAFNASLVHEFDANYARTTIWSAAPSNPTPYSCSRVHRRIPGPASPTSRCGRSWARRTSPTPCGTCSGPTAAPPSPNPSWKPRSITGYRSRARPARLTSTTFSRSGSTPRTPPLPERSSRPSPGQDSTARASTVVATLVADPATDSRRQLKSHRAPAAS